MKRTVFWRRGAMLGVLVLVALAFAALPVLAANDNGKMTVSPQSIIVNPKPAFTIDVWTDRGDGATYQVGDSIRIYFRVSRDAYVTIYDVDAAGRVTIIYPNDYDQDNFARAGRVYSLPSQPGYDFTVTPPAGTGYVQAVATLAPNVIDFGGEIKIKAQLAPQIKAQIETSLKGIQPNEWASDWVQYRVADRSNGSGWWPFPPKPRVEVSVRTWSGTAALYLDGRYLGNTPYRITNLEPGNHQLVALRAGYRAWVQDFYVSDRKDFYQDWIITLQPLN